MQDGCLCSKHFPKKYSDESYIDKDGHVTDPVSLWKGFWESTSDDIPNRLSATLGIHELIFVYGHGGTGKTFLWQTIICTLRAEAKIVLVVASSSIASLFLPASRTTHIRFKLPPDLMDESMCNVKNTHFTNLLRETDLIIWDEALMNDRCCFETLDRTLRDVLDAPDVLLGGKSIMLGSDLRQTHPVKRKSSKAEMISSSIAELYFWPNFKIWFLNQNMRLLQPDL
ncbi:DNA helicase [Tanacetum coccineum]